jgi:oligoribonuclease NrnB/cAMP/cGMP phosphodiesterase (DHH superfamily)
MDFSKIELVVSHDNCPDGLASALIVKSVLPEVPIQFIQYNTEAQRALKPRSGVLFVDFSPNIPIIEENGKRIPDQSVIREWGESGSLILDHHKTAKDIVSAFGKNGVFGDEVTQPGICGAYLAYQHVWVRLIGLGERFKYGSLVERFAKLAGIRDTWVRSSEDWPRACSQASVLSFMPREKWLAEPLHIHLNEWEKRYKWIGDILEEKNANRIDKAIRGSHSRTTPNGTRVVIFEGLSNSSDACEQLGSNADLVVGYGSCVEDGQSKTVFSTRTAGEFNCSAFAKSHGGGGHTKAAGFSVIEDYSVHPVQRFFNLLLDYEMENA